MNISELAKQIEALNQRAATLQQNRSQPNPADADLAFEELACALEELRVVEEELRQQNEELYEAQLTIAIEQQRYQELFEFAPDGYLITDPNGIIQEANRAAARLLSVRQQFLVGKPLANLVSQEARSPFRSQLMLLAQTDQTQEWEVRLEPRGREAFDAALTVAAVRDAQGNLMSLRWSLRDVTARKQAERQVFALNAELMQRSALDETLVQISHQVRGSLDESEILQTVVKELTLTLGLVSCDIGIYDLKRQTSEICCSYATESTVALSKSDTVLMADFAEGYRQLLQGQEFQFCEVTTDPIRQQFSMLVCPIVNHQDVLGDLWCFSQREVALNPSQVRFVQQVANQCAIALQQARLYQAAQAQVEELAALNRLKNDFLGTVSHELRTPLANMKMALHLLKSPLSEKQRSRCLQVLAAECDREIELVKDLLDLQQLETNSYPESLPEAIVLPGWISDITASFKQQLQTRQQTFTVDVPATLSVLITDRASLRRLLVKLLHNAHKYTPPGGAIGLEVQQSSSTHTTFILRNQAEIPPTELPRIFDKFYRVPQPDRWHTGGTGLGLALVKQLVDRLQGDITVESSNGWVTFTVKIPMRSRLSSSSIDFGQDVEAVRHS